MVIGGEERAFFTVKFPFVDEGGEIAGITGISTDITAKKQAEALQQELAAAQQRAIDELRRSRQETVERLARAIEMHDAETGEHVNRMAASPPSSAARLGPRAASGCCCCERRRRCTTSARSRPRTTSSRSAARSRSRSAR